MDQEEKDFIEQLRLEFRIDGEEQLTKCEQLILNFESTPEEKILIQFKRILHSFKGSAQEVGFNLLAQAVHLMEDTINENWPKSTENLANYQLIGIDLIREIIKCYRNNLNLTVIKEKEKNLITIMGRKWIRGI